MKRRLRVSCGQCARPHRKHTYQHCPHGCGTTLCRTERCHNDHAQQCPTLIAQADADATFMDTELNDDDYARLVIQYSLDPHCPGCGGNAHLRTGPNSPQLVIDHITGCPLTLEKP